MIEPKISVVTISFNQGRFLEQCILSILNQNYPNLEYIIIDGGSTDNSIEIIKKYANRLSYWESKRDNGPADALNRGFSFASGDIYYYLNSDDVLLQGTLEKIRNAFLKNPEVDVFYGNILMASENLKVLKRVYVDDWSVQGFSDELITIGQQGHFFKARAFNEVNGFFIENRTCWDAELFVDFTSNHYRFLRLDIFCAIFRLHSTSITGSSLLKQKYYDDVARIAKRAGITQVQRHKIARYILRVFISPGRFILRISDRLESIFKIGLYSKAQNPNNQNTWDILKE